MSATGQTSAISLVDTGLPLIVVSIQTPTMEGSSVDCPRLDLDSDEVTPKTPGDGIEAGQITVVCEFDESYDPPVNQQQDVVITYPLEPGMSTAATHTYVNAWVTSYEGANLEGNVRKLSTLTIEVTSKPVKTPAAA